MKRLFSLLLALLLALSLAACAAKPHHVPTPEAPLPELVLLPDESGQSDASDAQTHGAEPQAPPESQPVTEEPSDEEKTLPEDGSYTTKDDVALYLHLYGHLPDNFITKKEAEALGWTGGSLEPYAPGKCIGGSRFGNYEGLLPDADGRRWTECDVDTLGAKSRGAKRIVFSNDGLVYYTEDHYQSFELLYGEEQP